MEAKHMLWILFLQLILFTCSYGHEKGNGQGHDHMSHMKLEDQTGSVFFRYDDLKPGKIQSMYFPKKDLSKAPKFWPKEDADSVPFSLKELPNLLKRFGFEPDSREGKAMKGTLRQCENPPLKGEIKTCATSLEAMLDFAQRVVGPELKACPTTWIKGPTVNYQNFTFLDNIEEIPSPSMIACHSMAYPYAVFTCHSLAGINKVFKIPLLAKDTGDRADGMAVCHMDTTLWWEGHVSFKYTKAKPGVPLCHFIPFGDLFYVPKLPPKGFSSI